MFIKSVSLLAALFIIISTQLFIALQLNNKLHRLDQLDVRLQLIQSLILLEKQRDEAMSKVTIFHDAYLLKANRLDRLSCPKQPAIFLLYEQKTEIGQKEFETWAHCDTPSATPHFLISPRHKGT